MSVLVVGYDSAWTATGRGGLVGALLQGDGNIAELGHPVVANFEEASETIRAWIAKCLPKQTVIMLDQPTIVENATGMRDVERIVSSPIGVRRGGTQPANTSRTDMFGPGAPLWSFLTAFGGPADPFAHVAEVAVLETYPALAIAAFGWTVPGEGRLHERGILPKYNPARRKTFVLSHWEYVCRCVGQAFRVHGVGMLADWFDEAAALSPRKSDQDRVDAGVCLLVGLELLRGNQCLFVGHIRSGYVVVPFSGNLHEEMVKRAGVLGLGDAMVQTFRWPLSALPRRPTLHCS